MSKDKKLTLDQQRQKDLDKAMRDGDQKEIKRFFKKLYNHEIFIFKTKSI